MMQSLLVDEGRTSSAAKPAAARTALQECLDVRWHARGKPGHSDSTRDFNGPAGVRPLSSRCTAAEQTHRAGKQVYEGYTLRYTLCWLFTMPMNSHGTTLPWCMSW